MRLTNQGKDGISVRLRLGCSCILIDEGLQWLMFSEINIFHVLFWSRQYQHKPNPFPGLILWEFKNWSRSRTLSLPSVILGGGGGSDWSVDVPPTHKPNPQHHSWRRKSPFPPIKNVECFFPQFLFCPQFCNCRSGVVYFGLIWWFLLELLHLVLLLFN